MNICIISNGYPTSEYPQFGCFEKDQAYALSKIGHSITVIYIDGRYLHNRRKRGISYTYDEPINVYGIYIFPLAFLSILGYKLKYKLLSYILSYVFKKAFDKKPLPDVIYAHYLSNMANAILLKRKYGIPIVGLEHWSVLTQESLPHYVKYLGDKAYNSVDYLLAVSKSLASSIFTHFNIVPAIVNNLINEEFIDEIVSVPNYNFNFLSVGSLKKIKGYDILINAFYASGLAHKGCKVIIIGEGEERESLQKLIDKKNLSDCITLVGCKTKREIITYIEKSMIFIMSSHSETFGVACVESMALGTPVIATQCGGPQEYVNENNGVLVSTNSIDEMKNAMIYMYKNYNKYDRFFISNEIRSKFAPSVIAQQLTKIFEKVLSKV